MQFIKPLIAFFIAIIIILLDISNNLNYIKKTISTVVTPIYFLADFPNEIINWITDIGSERENLTKENRKLNNEFLELKTKLQIHNNLILENEKLSKLLNASYKIPEKKIKLAKINSISQSRLKKEIVINIGSNKDILKSQIALGANGVVGQVIQSTPFYSRIKLLTDPTQRVPVKNSRNGTRGLTKGIASNDNLIKVEFITNDVDVKLGDIFITSGIGGSYPSGYPVGEVIDIIKDNDDTFLSIHLKPIENINELEFVIIILDIL